MTRPEPAPPAVANGDPVRLVAVGTSAGGVEALRGLLRAVPRDTPLAFVLVPHQSPAHASHLAPLLQAATPLPVYTLDGDTAIARGGVYLPPPDRLVAIAPGRLQPAAPAARAELRHRIDHAFESLARAYGPHGAAVVLSGSGDDGSRGAAAVRAGGGRVLVQDPHEAEHDAMPRAVLAAGHADRVAPLDGLAAALAQWGRGVADNAAAPAADAPANGYRQVLELLRQATGHDFTGYKPSTLRRRIDHVIGLHGLDLAAYAEHLEAHPGEAESLLRELLIGTTGFFRDPPAWEQLAQALRAQLGHAGAPPRPLRAWVPGCASGEEAYSLAILLCELAGTAGPAAIQVFATDIDAQAIETAREGRYPLAVEQALSAQRLRRFFTLEGGGYRIAEALRERVVFARHDLLSDPPFSQLDVITCRNLLIYFAGELQQRALHTLHYALRRGGLLLLGASEGIDPLADRFLSVSAKWRLFRRPDEPPQQRRALVWPTTRGTGREPAPPSGPSQRDAAEPLAQAALRALGEHHGPPALLLDAAGRVLFVHGEAAPFLAPASGVVDPAIERMLRAPYRDPVRVALHRAQAAGEEVTVALRDAGDAAPLTLIVTPLAEEAQAQRFLAVFRPAAAATGDSARRHGGEDASRGELEDELDRTRAELAAALREASAAEGELHAAHDEALSAGEELRSTNEELETTREELQSLNQEMNLLNTALQQKVAQLEETQSDIANLLRSAHIPIVHIDRERRLRWFSSAAARLLGLGGADVGRPLADLAERLADPDLASEVEAVMDDLVPRQRELQHPGGAAFLRRVLPYRSHDERIGGIVLTLADVSELRRTERALAEANRELERFSGTVSHDLRAPLRAIDGFANILEEELAQRLDPAHRQLLARIGANVRRMSRMIDDILQFSRAASRPIERRRIDMDAMVAEVLDSERPPGSERAQVEVGALPPAAGDPVLVRQVWANLIGNAFKYSAREPHPAIAIGTRPGAGGPIYYVRDNGCGFDMADADQLFHSFKRLASASGFEGSGIGLGTAARVVERHGGRIWAEGRPGAGATFYFQLPETGAAQAAGAARRPTADT